MKQRAAPERATATPGAASSRAERADTQARVAGWVHRRRDHGGLIFIDLRDRSGIVQLVFHPETAPAAHDAAHALRSEDVITARGTVVRRDPENVNPNLPTGEIEVAVEQLEILADADTPPFPLDEDVAVDESLRLQAPRARPAPRAHASAASRCATGSSRRCARCSTTVTSSRSRRPYLTRSTPEGARDYPRPSARAAGIVLRAAAVAAAVQAAADDRRLRALLPDRPLLPRRGHPRRPPARVHAARPRDVVRGRGRRDRLHGGGDRRRVRTRRVRRPAAAVAADDVRRGRLAGSGSTVPTRGSGSSCTTSGRR